MMYKALCFSVKVLLIAVLAAGSLAAQTTPLPTVGQAGQTTSADPNYRIGVGDVLSVLVPKNALLTTDTVRVSNSGTIRLPMLEDEIPARCLTEAELSAEVTKRYKKYLLNPQVYVTVREFNSNPIAVVGAVNSPGRFQLQRPIRLLELMTYVNGVRDNAGRTVQIIRNPGSQSCSASPTEMIVVSADEEMIINLPLAELMKGTETANPYVYAGDIIQVAEAEQAYIIGNVRSAATINLQEPVTLTKAIAIAGGLADGAQAKKIKISRQGVEPMIVSLNDINERKAEDVLLQPNDIVEVPGPNKTKKFLKDLLRTIVPAVTRVPILIP